jgi:hypothetical protein
LRNDFLNQNDINELSDKELSIAILSWGVMNRRHAKMLFDSDTWLSLVNEMRVGNIRTRKEAYDQFRLFKKQGKLKGIGPAYFTKLICFVNRDLNGFIMDQWTAKSINLLVEEPFIHLTSAGIVSDSNTAEIYERFCKTIEELATIINKDSLETEELLFSYGGRQKGTWRQFVTDSYNHNKSKGKKKPSEAKETKTMKRTNQSKQNLTSTLMNPIEYNQAINFFSENQQEIPTLARRKSMNVFVEDGRLVVNNSSNNTYAINEKTWNKVMERMKELDIQDRATTKYYVLGTKPDNWQECPNKVLAIYIPAIVRYILEENGG